MAKFPKKNPMHPDRFLASRRDFLSSGLLGLSTAAVLPNIFDLVLFEREARAGECPAEGAFPGTIPFLVFDCAGGASLSGNWVPYEQEGRAGQPLANYSKLGLGDTSQFVIDTQFGAPMAAPLVLNPDLMSQIYASLTTDRFLPPEVRRCLKMGIICHTSLSDSQTNMLSAVSLVTAAGFRGTSFKNGLGLRTSNSAGNSDAASLSAAYRPMGVQSVDSLNNALSYGPAFAILPTAAKDALAKALSRLSESQSKRLMGMGLGDQFTALAKCGFIKNTGYTSGLAGIDARTDADIPGIYTTAGMPLSGSPTDREVLTATLVKAAVEGNSGPAVITIGGCDYHTGNRTAGDAKDAEIGRTIALALTIAHKKGKKVAFQVFTDGGIYSDDGTRVWRGDDNDKSLTIFGVMDPAGPREMVSPQLGRYTSGQGADRNHFLGTDPVKVAHTVFLNYLAACGMAGRYAEIAKGTGRDISLPTDKLDSLLLFPNKA